MEQQRFPNDFNGGHESVYTPTSDERTLGILAHALTFAFPLLAPLIIYLIKKDESRFVRENAKESLNFQITAILACIVLFITIVGIFFIWIVGIGVAVLVIMASIKASEGKVYRYPLSIRFIK